MKFNYVTAISELTRHQRIKFYISLARELSFRLYDLLENYDFHHEELFFLQEAISRLLGGIRNEYNGRKIQAEDDIAGAYLYYSYFQDSVCSSETIGDGDVRLWDYFPDRFDDDGEWLEDQEIKCIDLFDRLAEECLDDVQSKRSKKAA